MSELYYYEERDECSWDNEYHEWHYLLRIEGFGWLKIHPECSLSIISFESFLLADDANWVRLV